MKHSLLSLLGLCGIVLGCLLAPLTGQSAGAPKTPKTPKAAKAPKTLQAQAPKRVDFDRDVRPILSENCFACHGFDANKRQATLRLDVPEGAYKKLPTGHVAIVPGKPAASELIKRVTATDAFHMPPYSSGKKLTAAQISTLRAWIAQGGKYDPHWAFVAPKRPPLPQVKNKTWPRNPIDYFVLARLEKEGLHPSPEADRTTLIRRVSLDLTGLPPTPAEVQAFVNDKRPDAYERLVDRLLASPHYGERMALAWLDLARYADTHGYHIDSQRDMWPWRDWVIKAFNTNLPYDQFIIQQLAGDLLPNATLDQKIATGFNRNHPINFEGGAIPEEYQVAYVVDRVDTTATAFMGLTMKCAECHDHKYDPISQKDYFHFYAYFNNIAEQGLDGQKGNAAPYIKAPSPEQAQLLEAYTKKVGEAEQAVKARVAATASAQAEWEQSARAALESSPAASAGLAAHIALDENTGEQIHDAAGKLAAGTVHGKAAWAAGKVGSALNFDGNTYIDLGTTFGFDKSDTVSYGAWIYPTSGEAMTVLSRMDDQSDFRGWDMFLIDGKVYVHLIHKWDQNAIRVNTKNPVELNKWSHVFVTYDGSGQAKGLQIYINGKPAELDITHNNLTDTIRTDKPLLIGRRNPAAPFKGMIDEVRVYNRQLAPAEVAQLVEMDSLRPILTTPAEKRTPEQKETLSQYLLEKNDAEYRKLTAALADWRRKYTELDNAIPTTMVMQELTDKPRETFMLVRGQYDQHGEKVTPGTPAFLPPLPKGAPNNRLGLAMWLVDPSHPLTARVAVNHFWQMVFGYGLVRTAENFGVQGERPTHPQLLDWLATEFIRTRWNVKAMLRQIVTSATYRQSSRVSPALLEKDPENRLLARGPRFRLQGELIRDQALAVSGLLVDKIGGPPVKPYQPAGLWEEISFKGGFSAQFYEQDHGDKLYRRSMYIFWKRTVPPPALQTFDAPEREFCMPRRSITNTPLQALVLMNDPTYIEAARKLAERLLTESGPTPQARIQYAYRLALARAPRETEIKVLQDILEKQWARFRANQDAALKLLSVGESKRNEKLDPAELAAWTTVASVLLNLDETITKS
ncbi:MAG TPA: DUF1553 domain-containing protein [Chthonomonadaceae bacterium]|nr:DUF1553 domain-containing protein [Chthonomonadaceae bacterium]